VARMGELLDKLPLAARSTWTPACTAALFRQVPLLPGHRRPEEHAVARQDLMRAVYRRYFTFAGKHFPKLVGAVDMSKDVLDQW